MTAMSLPGLPLSQSTLGELVLTTPYMVVEVDAPPNCPSFYVMHRRTKTCACEHFNYVAAKLCADGIRCVKNRKAVSHR